MPDNVPFGIDVDGICVEAGWGINRRIRTVIVEKAMYVGRIITVYVNSDDLPFVVDA